MSGQGRLISAPNKTGRIELRCGTCGCREAVSLAYASKRTVFCSTCHAVLREPQAESPPEPPARPERATARPTSRTGGSPRAKREWTRVERPAGAERLIDMEKHVRAIGVWYRLTGVLGILGAVVMSVALHPAALTGALLFMIPLLLGHFLAKYHGWARWAVVVLGVLSVAGHGFQLVMSGPQLTSFLQIGWDVAVVGILLTPAAGTIFTPAYRNAVARSPHLSVPFWKSPFFLLPVGMFAFALLQAFVF